MFHRARQTVCTLDGLRPFAHNEWLQLGSWQAAYLPYDDGSWRWCVADADGENEREYLRDANFLRYKPAFAQALAGGEIKVDVYVLDRSTGKGAFHLT